MLASSNVIVLGEITFDTIAPNNQPCIYSCGGSHKTGFPWWVPIVAVCGGLAAVVVARAVVVAHSQRKADPIRKPVLKMETSVNYGRPVTSPPSRIGSKTPMPTKDLVKAPPNSCAAAEI